MRYQLDLKAGWEVTMGERGESRKDTKGGRSSRAEKGSAQSRESIIGWGPSRGEPSGGLDAEK